MKIIAYVLLITSLFSCSSEERILVLVSKDPTQSYTSWLLSLDSTIKVRDFYNIDPDSMNYFLKIAGGILMTGGEDVNPALYGKSDYKDLCESPDNFRDSIEQVMIRYSMKFKVPMLGVCRGQQIINVVNGGTLTPDIPTAHPESNISHRSKSDKAHVITPTPSSWILKENSMKAYWVNSRHHQCVDQIANGFGISAYSPDGIIESIEIKDNRIHPFIICVQWHPENLRDSLATSLGGLFLNEVKK